MKKETFACLLLAGAVLPAMAMAMTAANNLIAALSGQRPPNLINPEVWQ